MFINAQAFNFIFLYSRQLLQYPNVKCITSIVSMLYRMIFVMFVRKLNFLHNFLTLKHQTAIQ